ncbi:MAG: acetylxylan esterase [Candidatus Hydrogenedentes bacterium]|nr:acetylxylan esterase [Candidatus Hydrogenedentota bacterium]
MESFSRFLDGHCNVHIQLWEHLREKTFAALNEHTRRKEAIASADEVAARGAMIRETFLSSLGGLPSSVHPLNARIAGVVERSGYTIEKVIFESQPSVYVTSLFYLPLDRKGRIPAILFVSGHHREAKCNPEYQRVCHDFAINGFAVLAIDPTGQGERTTYLDPDSGEDPIGWGTSEHSYQGVQCILTGTSIARYFLHDALRALDYLQSRPEVDASRIGVTGNSGGGTQTSLLCMSGDPRIKVAAPCTYVTSREHYYVTGQPQDAEQIQFAMTKNGINFDDMFLPFAPRPLLLGAVESDFFNPEGTALTYERLRRLYRIAGAEENVSCVFAPGQHMYCKELREAVVRWFSWHLQGVESAFVSEEDDRIATLPQEELWCTSKGHVGSDFPGAKSPFELNVDCIPRRAAAANPEELRSRIVETLRIRGRIDSQCGLFPRTLRTSTVDRITLRSVYFLSEPGIMVSGCWLHNADAIPDEAVIVLTDKGTADLDGCAPVWRPIVDAGKAAFVFDARGTGSVQADPINPYGEEYPLSLFNTDNWLSFCAYCVGECLLGMRVFDVLRAIACVRAAGYARMELSAKGLGPALWGYLAAALDPTIRVASVEGLINSFESIVRTRLYRKDFGPSALVHGVLASFDLPELRPLFDGRQLTVG